MSSMWKGRCGQVGKLFSSNLYRNAKRNYKVHCTDYMSSILKGQHEAHRNSGIRSSSRVLSSSSSEPKYTSSRRRKTSEGQQQNFLHSSASKGDTHKSNRSSSKLPKSGPQLADFVRLGASKHESREASKRSWDGVGSVPYINPEILHGRQRKGERHICPIGDSFVDSARILFVLCLGTLTLLDYVLNLKCSTNNTCTWSLSTFCHTDSS